MTTILEQAVVYIKAGDLENGKKLLIQVIQKNPRDENAWLWMSRCVTSVEQKRECFKKALNINPTNRHAIEGLQRFDNAKNMPLMQHTIQTNASQTTKKLTDNKKSNLAIIIAGIAGLILFWYMFSVSVT